MPEGDSLHALAQRLGPLLAGKPLRALSFPRRTDRTDGLPGRVITGVEARGKNLLLHLERNLSVHVHLKMNGRVRVFPRDSGPSGDASRAGAAGTVLVLETDTHRVVCQDAPVARLIRTSDIPRDLHFRDLGPDLLAPHFDEGEALRRLRQRAAAPLSESLMDQSVVAGIGNVWKSELCFLQRLDPFAPVSAFDDAELAAVLSLARSRMRDAVYGPRRTLPDPFAGSPHGRRPRLHARQGEGRLSVYGRAGERCYDCGAVIEMQTLGTNPRSTYHCPGCQPSRPSEPPR